MVNESRDNRGGSQGYVPKQNYQPKPNQGEEPKEKRFGAKFKIRGIICKGKTGEAFDVITTRNNTPMCSISLMVSKYQPNGQVGQDGRDGFDEFREYFKIIAFKDIANEIMGTAKVHSTVDIVGTISHAPEYNGKREIQFIADSIELISMPKPKTEYSNQNRQPYVAKEQRDDRPPARTNYPPRQAPEKPKEYSYEDRPKNTYKKPPAQQEAPRGNYRNQQEDDGFNGNRQDDNEIPF
jgi:hypothetical protein